MFYLYLWSSRLCYAFLGLVSLTVTALSATFSTPDNVQELHHYLDQLDWLNEGNISASTAATSVVLGQANCTAAVGPRSHELPSLLILNMSNSTVHASQRLLSGFRFSSYQPTVSRAAIVLLVQPTGGDSSHLFCTAEVGKARGYCLPYYSHFPMQLCNKGRRSFRVRWWFQCPRRHHD